MTESAQLLSPSANYAVVQLPGRKFPGVVFQGDSLHSLAHKLQFVLRLAEKADHIELHSEVQDVCNSLNEVLLHYESTCMKHGIPLPYKP